MWIMLLSTYNYIYRLYYKRSLILSGIKAPKNRDIIMCPKDHTQLRESFLLAVKKYIV